MEKKKFENYFLAKIRFNEKKNFLMQKNFLLELIDLKNH